MRLGTRLILAFLMVAFVPAGAVLTFTWFTVEERFQREFQERLEGVAEGIRTDLQRIGTQLQRKVKTFSESEIIEKILVDMVRGNLDRRALVPEAGKWMLAWDLDLLSVLDGSGTVLSSGHLPARSGSQDEASRAIAANNPMTPIIQQVQVLREGSIESILAVVVGGGRRFNQAEVMLLGGKLLDDEFIADLENLSGARIQIVDAGDRILVAGSGHPDPAGAPWESEPGITTSRIPLPPDGKDAASAFVVVGVSETKLMEAQQRIVIASVGAAAVGVLISWLLGLLISRRILGPVQALVGGARFIAKGDLEHRVPETSTGELGDLVRTFNQMADDLAAYSRRLVRAERVAAWQEIARRIAHEIKNPLSPIQVSIETLRKTYASGHPEFREIFEESTQAILEEVAALKRIVTEFSEFARLPKPTPTVQDLNPVVESTVNLYRNEAGSRLTFQPAENLPGVAIDREQVGRVVANLLSNALWAAAPDGKVGVSTAARGDRVLLKISDEGRGMSEQVLQKVFTPYFTTRQDGTGLGLAIVQRIVEDHGGSVEVESREGEGTTFTVALPVTRS